MQPLQRAALEPLQPLQRAALQEPLQPKQLAALPKQLAALPKQLAEAQRQPPARPCPQSLAAAPRLERW
jgi:hypothetical protein